MIDAIFNSFKAKIYSLLQKNIKKKSKKKRKLSKKHVNKKFVYKQQTCYTNFIPYMVHKIYLNVIL